MRNVAKSTDTIEFGDFQTPYGLASEACRVLSEMGVNPQAIIEPTCGEGSFLLAALNQFPGVTQAIGVDISPPYVAITKAKINNIFPTDKVTVQQGNFFTFPWKDFIATLSTPLLVIGNPPWVTNAQLGVLGSDNLPEKSNFQNRTGLDAITGKSNFDISEWMLLQMLDWLNGKQATLAMLCKNSVARKVLTYAWKKGYQLAEAKKYLIDADLHFDAAVEACLLVCHFEPHAGSTKCTIFPSLKKTASSAEIGYDDGLLIADMGKYNRWKHLHGTGLVWRSGIKHDCSKVMELRRDGDFFVNGLGEKVQLEDAYLYPMLKSSELVHGKQPSRWMIVTQKYVGEETDPIKDAAPQTWQYLTDHAAYLDKRASSIYRNKPPFSIFGVGNYSFSPWKVAISALYKRLEFSLLSSYEHKPIVLDDTQNFLPCTSFEEANRLTKILNSDVVKEFFEAFIFWDEKRPITIQLLKYLNLNKLLGRSMESPIHNEASSSFNRREQVYREG